MRLKRLAVKNYRTLEDVNLEFPSFYTAVCGQNNSGKSNVIRAIRFLMQDRGRPYSLFEHGDIRIEPKLDATAWKRASGTENPIELKVEFEIDRQDDHGLVEFVERLGKLDATGTSQEDRHISLRIEMIIHGKQRARTQDIEAFFGDVKLDDVGCQELVKKLKSSSSLIFHNSTAATNIFFGEGNRVHGMLQNLSAAERANLDKKKAALSKELGRHIESHQTELSSLLGRLEEKYRLKLTVPEMEFDALPFEISLGEKDYDVPLDDWGSGTRNRTLILKSIFDAKQAALNKDVSDKITPIVVIEEPESFLHPLAQAQFGRILQDLTSELQIQVIATTHSPYLLSHQDPSSNILLARERTDAKSPRGTRVVPVTGIEWVKPFEHALGVSGPDFDRFREAVFSKANALILVEGEIDRLYLEMCRGADHGKNALSPVGEIVPYGGFGNIQNAVLLKFIRDRFKVVVVTFDLDVEDQVKRNVESLGFKRDATYFPIGIDQPGRRSIEGYLPAAVKQSVQSKNPSLVDALASDNKDEVKKAKDKLKQLYLEEFQKTAVPGEEYYGEFYKFIRKINKALQKLC